MIHSIKNIINFYISADSKDDSDSNFKRDFITEIMDTKREYYAFPVIEQLRQQLLNNNKEIAMLDYGAGSKYKASSIKISDIAKRSLSSTDQCRILFNLVNHYKTGNVLELGTSLGISTMYLASPDTKNTIITLEGNPSSAEIARKNFSYAGLKNIELIEGIFSETLIPALKKINRVDLAFLDGNHRYDATLEYYKEILNFSHDDSIIVLDDIYWSSEMMEVWEHIKGRDEVAATIDLYYMGIIFFNKNLDLPKSNKLIQKKYKPF